MSSLDVTVQCRLPVVGHNGVVKDGTDTGKVVPRTLGPEVIGRCPVIRELMGDTDGDGNPVNLPTCSVAGMNMIERLVRAQQECDEFKPDITYEGLLEVIANSTCAWRFHSKDLIEAAMAALRKAESDTKVKGMTPHMKEAYKAKNRYYMDTLTKAEKDAVASFEEERGEKFSTDMEAKIRAYEKRLKVELRRAERMEEDSEEREKAIFIANRKCQKMSADAIECRDKSLQGYVNRAKKLIKDEESTIKADGLAEFVETLVSGLNEVEANGVRAEILAQTAIYDAHINKWDVTDKTGVVRRIISGLPLGYQFMILNDGEQPSCVQDLDEWIAKETDVDTVEMLMEIIKSTNSLGYSVGTETVLERLGNYVRDQPADRIREILSFPAQIEYDREGDPIIPVDSDSAPETEDTEE